MKSQKLLNIGSAILITGYLGLSSVSFVIAKDAELSTATGRHLLAGALANASFAISQMLITNFALRNGEQWAWWSNLIPMVGYGFAILIIDATHVKAANLFATLLPQVIGLCILVVGLIISWMGLPKKIS